MKKIIIILVGLLIAGCSGKGTYKLAIMDSEIGEPYECTRNYMIDSLKNLGYIAGQNLEIFHVSIGNNADIGEAMIKAVKKKNPDVIFLNGTIVSAAARKSYYNRSGYRFIFANTTDPVGVGLIKDFKEKSGGNFAGISYGVPLNYRLQLIKLIFPGKTRIGYIHSDMPQSRSYKNWIDSLIKTDPHFRDLKMVYREVPFKLMEQGYRKMLASAEKHIIEINGQVDIFMSSLGIFGARKEFAEAVWRSGTKPLVGLGINDIKEDWGAVFSIYSSHEGIGEQAAYMIKSVFEGNKISDIVSERPKQHGLAFNLKKAKRYNLTFKKDILKMARAEDIVK